MELFQSSYLYTEGLDSLGKATLASSSRLRSSNSPSRTKNGESGATAQARDGAGGVGNTSSFSSSSSARRDISSKLKHGAFPRPEAAVRNGSHSPVCPGSGKNSEAFSESGDDDKKQGDSRKRWKRDGKTEIREPQQYAQSAFVCQDGQNGSNSPGGGIGGYRGGGRTLGKGEQLVSTSFKNIGGARLASGSPDIGAVLRRFVAEWCSRQSTVWNHGVMGIFHQ